MKITVTDEFLWDLYYFLEGTRDVLGLIFKPYPTFRTIAPNLGGKIIEKYKKRGREIEFRKLLYYLKTKGYIKVKSLEAGKAILITKKGIDKVLAVDLKTDKKQKRKDGKLTMIVFDIPEKKKHLRFILRGALCNWGYKMLQLSVWISPYDVLGKTEKFIQKYSMENYVKIFLIEKI